MINILCDRCAQFRQDGKQGYQLPVTIRRGGEKDLCEKCEKELEEWWDVKWRIGEGHDN